MPAWLTVVIVIVVVLLVALAIYAVTGRRRSDHRRERADQLRDEASTQAAVLPESERQAEDLRAGADLARTEAARAEEQAANAEQGHRVEQASYEDKLREADRLDPEVDHRAGDYEPDVWNDETKETPTESSASSPSSASSAPRHASTREQTPSEDTTER